MQYIFISSAIIAAAFFQSCSPSNTSNKQEETSEIEFIDQFIVPNDYIVEQTIIGGLSSIDFAPDGTAYIISDDRSEFDPARFYKVDIPFNLGGIDTVLFNETIFLKNRRGESYEFNALDPEAIRYNSRSHTLFYSSEGGRKEGTIAPFIREMDTVGNFIRELEIPDQFNFYDDYLGVRDNGVLESLSFENDSALWYANELPLIEDGEVPQYEKTFSPIRLSKMDIESNDLLAQYAYMIEPVQAKPAVEGGFNINSVTEILVLDDLNLLVMERSYIQGVGNYVKVFKVNLTGATNVEGIEALINVNFNPVKKELFIDFSDYNKQIDNIEGMAFGPDFEDGRKSLLFVSDNNFSESQQTQFWLFALDSL